MDRIEKLFYEDIINEAAIGNIDCDFFLPICFGTSELKNNEIIDITTPKHFEGAMIPTLLIKDRSKLNESIKKYVSLASEFYKHDVKLSIVPDVEKYIISTLLSNTLITDFNDIDKLFERHANFFDLQGLEEFLKPTNLGYSEKLKSNMVVSIEKQSILQETPYGLSTNLMDEEGNIIYKFPIVRFGIDGDKAYIYAVQGMDDNENKKIERLLRKTGEGFDERGADRDPISNPENLYSVSPWSLVALTTAIALIKSNTDVKEFVAPYFLVNRWNAIPVSYQILKEALSDKMDNPNSILTLQKKEKIILEQEDNQRNVTDKFLRNFRRLEHHFSNISIKEFELDMDSSVHFCVEENMECNNSLLREVYTLVSGNTKAEEKTQRGMK